jgi:hypothetical protein
MVSSIPVHGLFAVLVFHSVSPSSSARLASTCARGKR